MFKNKQKIILLSFFIVGLAIRLLFLFTKTHSDPVAYLEWGNRVLERGLALGFQGTYFPLQWQIFSFEALVSKLTLIDYNVVMKGVTLLFDVGNFFLFLAILKRMKLSSYYALIYWLHPWFLVIFSLGYVDFQFTFFILLFLYILLKGQDFSHYFWAGLPLGLSLLMKPQSEILIFLAFAYAVIDFIRCRKIKSFALLIFPTALFIGYEIYFFIERWPVKGALKAALILPYYYLTVSNVKAQLTAQMLNFWYPVVYFLREPDAPFYINSNIYLLPFIKAKTLATVVTLSVVSWYAFAVNKKSDKDVEAGTTYLLIFAFASTIVPFIMTSAHENHLFLATVLFILLLAKFGGRLFNFAFQALIVIQFINVYLAYTYDRFGLFFQKYYTFEVKTILAIVSVILFILVLKSLIQINAKRGIQGNV